MMEALHQRFRELRIEVELFRIRRTRAELQLPILRELTDVGHKLRMLGGSTTMLVGIDTPEVFEGASVAFYQGLEMPRTGWRGDHRGGPESARHKWAQATRSGQ